MIKRIRKKNNRSILFGLLITSLIILYPTLVYARAGSGESFGDGGFDSGGMSSDWSSGNSSGGWVPGSSGLTRVPSGIGFFLLGLLILIIIIAATRGGRPPVSGGGNSNDNTEGNINNRSMTPGEIKENLDKLKAADPMFDEQKFKTYVKKTFMAVQEGWKDRDQSICRPFMAEEVYQSHELQIESMKEIKTINILENIVIGSLNIVRVDIGQEYHKLAVKIRASMKDYKINEDTKQIVEGSKNQLPPFTEYWIFMRRANLRTKIKNGFFDRKCPNCGAPIEVKVSGECKYCDANVVNGDYDWVLSEIVQKSEWMD